MAAGPESNRDSRRSLSSDRGSNMRLEAGALAQPVIPGAQIIERGPLDRKGEPAVDLGPEDDFGEAQLGAAPQDLLHVRRTRTPPDLQHGTFSLTEPAIIMEPRFSRTQPSADQCQTGRKAENGWRRTAGRRASRWPRGR